MPAGVAAAQGAHRRHHGAGGLGRGAGVVDPQPREEGGAQGGGLRLPAPRRASLRAHTHAAQDRGAVSTPEGVPCYRRSTSSASGSDGLQGGRGAAVEQEAR